MPPPVFLRSSEEYRVVKVIVSPRSVLNTVRTNSKEDIIELFLNL